MRKVIFNKFIDAVTMCHSSVIQQGTNVWEEEYKNEGVFLAWGLFDGSTVALIELEDGSVEDVAISRFKFLPEPTPAAIPLEAAKQECDFLINKLGKDGAIVYCEQDMRDASSSERYNYLLMVKNLILDTTINLFDKKDSQYWADAEREAQKNIFLK